jgi:hypothetical protein
LTGFLGVSAASLRVDGRVGRVEERLDTLELLIGIVGDEKREKAVLARFLGFASDLLAKFKLRLKF